MNWWPRRWPPAGHEAGKLPSNRASLCQSSIDLVCQGPSAPVDAPDLVIVALINVRRASQLLFVVSVQFSMTGLIAALRCEKATCSRLVPVESTETAMAGVSLVRKVVPLLP